MLPNDLAGHANARRPQPVVVFKFNCRLEPELGLAPGVLDVDVWPRLFT
jgi:hypothetical protein